MKVNELSACLATSQLYGDGDVEITDLQTDSRRVGPGDLFICLPGHTVDGHKYAPQAVASERRLLYVSTSWSLISRRLLWMTAGLRCLSCRMHSLAHLAAG